jgi:hypothetical protein
MVWLWSHLYLAIMHVHIWEIWYILSTLVCKTTQTFMLICHLYWISILNLESWNCSPCNRELLLVFVHGFKKRRLLWWGFGCHLVSTNYFLQAFNPRYWFRWLLILQHQKLPLKSNFQLLELYYRKTFSNSAP